MKKIYTDIFFVTAVFIIFLLETGGFATGLVLAFLLAVIMLGSDRWSALSAFVGGFLLDLVFRSNIMGITIFIFLFFNLIFQFINQYFTVNFWHKLVFSILCTLSYHLYLLYPDFSVDSTIIILRIGLTLFLSWLFYFLLTSLKKFLKTDSHLQLSMQV